MISRIQQIRGVRRFNDFRPKPYISLNRMNLVYSENGLGKSTLAQILRSLDRKHEITLESLLTIKAKDQCIVLVGDCDARHVYRKSTQEWTRRLDRVLVFDQQFIDSNVCVGSKVDTENVRNLVDVVLGDTAIELQAQVVKVKDEIDSQMKRKRKLESCIQALIQPMPSGDQGKMSVQDFVELASRTGLESEIEILETSLERSRREESLRQRPRLLKLELPSLPTEALRQLLTTTIDGLGKESRMRLQEHLDKFGQNGHESWIREGNALLASTPEFCPFCGQSLDQIDLIAVYQELFSQVYQEHIAKLERFDTEYLDFRQQMRQIRTTLASNSERARQWGEDLESAVLPSVDVENIEMSLSRVSSEYRLLIMEKKRMPHSALEFTARAHETLNDWIKLDAELTEYNESVAAVNVRIGEMISALDDVETEVLEEKLTLFKNTMERHSEETAATCSEYQCVISRLDTLNEDKDQLQRQIDRTIAATYAKYKEDLNCHLVRFGAGFRVSTLEPSRDSRQPRVRYAVEVLTGQIPIGPKQRDQHGRSFSTVLSEGDKRTLALAFFLAQLDRMDSLRDAILVFDDPMGSLDTNRTLATVEAIGDMSRNADQTFVLSHSADFLYWLWDRYCNAGPSPIPCKLLEIRGMVGAPKYSEILEDWDIVHETRSEHAKKIHRVIEYLADPAIAQRGDIVRILRPIIETHLRIRYPHEYKGKVTSLGGFIKLVVETRTPGHDRFNPDSPLCAISCEMIAELDSLNKFLTPSQHGGEVGSAMSEASIAPYCKRVLALVGRPELN